MTIPEPPLPPLAPAGTEVPPPPPPPPVLTPPDSPSLEVLSLLPYPPLPPPAYGIASDAIGDAPAFGFTGEPSTPPPPAPAICTYPPGGA